MRPAWKAAAILLSSAISSAYVVPEAGALVKVSEQEGGTSPPPMLRMSYCSQRVEILTDLLQMGPLPLPRLVFLVLGV